MGIVFHNYIAAFTLGQSIVICSTGFTCNENKFVYSLTEGNPADWQNIL